MSGGMNGTGIGAYNLQEMRATKKAGDQTPAFVYTALVLLTGPERVTLKHFGNTRHDVLTQVFIFFLHAANGDTFP